MKLKAYAKINWILEIVGIKNGFHMLDGVMETVGLWDIIDINLREDREIHTRYDNMDTMQGDLCEKAARAFYEVTGINGGVDIYVEKHIPMGAGLGGGSSDCACVLCALNEMYDNPLTKAQLLKTGAKLGADVAFFVEGGAQRAQGKGEVLSSLGDIPEQRLILARPKGQGVSTPAAFKLYDSMEEQAGGDVDGMIEALKRGNPQDIAKKLFNSLEAPSLELLPAIGEVKQRLLDAGAIGAMMTGSGSAVIGILGERELKESMLGDTWYCICDTVKKPREILD